ncbi:MAG: class I SAM-dependent methyltransferase [Dehalococcoidales bacterium]|nr:MAG: class I SAM-dependent methyltransferase [Dehalococcoidales bacterium]
MASEDGEKFQGYDPVYYDLTYGKNFKDLPFYTDITKDIKGKVLEVACGSGRTYLELLQAGVDIHGIDLSEKMLDGLKKKAEAMNLTPKVSLADMRNFSLYDSFDMIIIPGRSFIHNVTTDDQLSTLKSCHNHLAEGGRLVMNLFYPNRDVMATKYNRENIIPMDKPVEGMELVNWSGFVNEPDQVIVTKMTWKQDGEVVSEFISELAYIYKREFELLLRLAGFSSWQVYGGFEYQPLETINQEMVWIVNK